MSPNLIIGFLLLGVAVLCQVNLGAARKKLHRMQLLDVSSVEHLETLARSMLEGVGERGLMRFATEIRGTIRAEQPLISELAQQPCVYYAMRVTREYEETYWDTDDRGNRVRRTRRGSQVMAENRRHIPFEVEDATGSVRVDPSGADMVAEPVLSEFRQEQGQHLQMGQFRLPVAYGGAGTRTLGYRYQEEIIPLGREIYVLGEASDAEGRLSVGRPSDGSTFLVSMKGEAQLLDELTKKIKMLKIGAIGGG
ncbi:MAG: E3 ubiquitin ligase family protein, partial [Acidobacteriota bacterium]